MIALIIFVSIVAYFLLGGLIFKIIITFEEDFKDGAPAIILCWPMFVIIGIVCLWLFPILPFLNRLMAWFSKPFGRKK